ncbi:unnamed protein product [Linum trigynum]|uniref:acylphosphatase n=1 Tax=Linum trigynum TaxID=586398 RepID=A0AAV2FLV0_9ROSI
MGISSPTPLRVSISARFVTTISRSISKDPEPWLSTTITGKHGSNRTTRLSIIARLGSCPLPIPISLHPRRPLSHPPLRTLFQPRSPRFRPPLFTIASMTSSASSDPKTVRVVIKGRVQGVFYRDWTVGNATELGLKGWVRNRRDGAVEALFSGDPAKVDEMSQRCRRGPPSAVVTGLEVFPCDDDPGSGFERKPTV